MEEVSDILVLLLIAVASLIGSINKKKKLQQTTPIPDLNPIDELAEESSRNLKHRTVEGKGLFTEKITPRYAQKSLDETQPVPSNEKETTPIQFTNVNNRDFDLRAAIIYSEILTPKFKEY